MRLLAEKVTCLRWSTKVELMSRSVAKFLKFRFCFTVLIWVSTIAACLYRVQLVKVNSGQFGLSLDKVKWARNFSFPSVLSRFHGNRELEGIGNSCHWIHRLPQFFPELWSLFRFTFIARKWVKPSSGAPLVVKIGRVSSSLYSEHLSISDVKICDRINMTITRGFYIWICRSRSSQHERVESIGWCICVLQCPECSHKLVLSFRGSAVVIFEGILSSDLFLLRSWDANDFILLKEFLGFSRGCTVAALSETRDFESKNLHRFASINFRRKRAKVLF